MLGVVFGNLSSVVMVERYFGGVESRTCHGKSFCKGLKSSQNSEAQNPRFCASEFLAIVAFTFSIVGIGCDSRIRLGPESGVGPGGEGGII